MPAVSKEQQTAMRMALAARKGDLEKSKLKGAALEIYNSDMTNKQIKDFTVLKEAGVGTSLKSFLEESMNESILGSSNTGKDYIESIIYDYLTNPEKFEGFTGFKKEDIEIKGNIVDIKSVPDGAKFVINENIPEDYVFNFYSKAKNFKIFVVGNENYKRFLKNIGTVSIETNAYRGLDVNFKNIYEWIDLSKLNIKEGALWFENCNVDMSKGTNLKGVIEGYGNRVKRPAIIKDLQKFAL